MSFAPLEAALADPDVGIAGPFGIVTHDLREFEDAAGPGDCDAIEGYCMAMRRELLTEVGLFDEKFRWYRMADIELLVPREGRGLAHGGRERAGHQARAPDVVRDRPT